MIDLLTALALVLVIEGLVIALLPHRVRQVSALLEQISPDVLRLGGLAAAVVGVACVWLLRG